MNLTTTRWLGKGFLVALLIALGGCAAPGVGYDYGEDYYGTDGYYGGASIGYGVGYYEPLGYDYGAWHPGYRIGPPPRGKLDHMSHPIPSIPTRPRSKHPGGQHSGGDGGRQH